jgi:hypothetical protein
MIQAQLIQGMLAGSGSYEGLASVLPQQELQSVFNANQILVVATTAYLVVQLKARHVPHCSQTITL